MLESVTIDKIKNNTNLKLIDIRSVERYNSNHITNSINIPFEQLILKPEKYLAKNEKYYIYCQKGIQSKKICFILKNKGYNVVNIIGGYEAWILSE